MRYGEGVVTLNPIKEGKVALFGGGQDDQNKLSPRFERVASRQRLNEGNRKDKQRRSEGHRIETREIENEGETAASADETPCV